MKSHLDQNTVIAEDIFSPQSDPLFGFCIMDSLDESCFGDMASRVHRHPFYEMVIVDEADGSHIIDEQIYTNMKNVVFLISPGYTHCWKNVTKAKGILVYFNDQFLVESCLSVNSLWEVQLFKEIAQDPAIYMTQEISDKMHDIARNMLTEYSARNEEYGNVIRAYLNIMLIEFQRYHRMIVTQKNTMDNNLFIRFEQLLDKKIYENLSVVDFAKLMGISAGYLNAQVKKHTGKSAGTVIKAAQIMEIKRILRNTDLNIEEISEKMCFRDPAYFTRSFKKEVGMTPSAYRKMKQ